MTPSAFCRAQGRSPLNCGKQLITLKIEAARRLAGAGNHLDVLGQQLLPVLV
jgi:hypothetical protein